NFIGQIITGAGTYFLDFYTSPLADSSGFGQGKSYIGSATLNVDSTGKATFNVSFLSAPTSDRVVTVTATDANGNTSEFSAATALQVLKPAPDQTGIQLSSSANPSTFGQSVTLTATVNDLINGTSIPSGTVEFMEGTTLLGMGTLDSHGHAAISISNF